MSQIPYTYLIYCIPEDKVYYGVQHGCKANPKNLWKTYFTSSIFIKQLIKKYGKESFKFEVRKTFSSREKAVFWERKVLYKMKNHPKFLNFRPNWFKINYTKKEKTNEQIFADNFANFVLEEFKKQN